MLPIEALEEAKRIKRELPKVNAEDLDYLARDVLAVPNKAYAALLWAQEVGTHIDEMASVIIAEQTPALACEWAACIDSHYDEMAQVVLGTNDVFLLVKWCVSCSATKEARIPFKMRAIELGQVEDFVENRKHYHTIYSMKEFYSDLPLEARLEVLV